MRSPSTHSFFKALRFMLCSLRKLVSRNLTRFALQKVLLLWSRFNSVISRRWRSLDKDFNPPSLRQSLDNTLAALESSILEPLYDSPPQNDNAFLACSAYPPSSVAWGEPQNLNVLRPVEITDYHNHARSHVSLPNLITTDVHPHVLEPTESDSPVRVEPEGDVISTKVGATLSHPRIHPLVPQNIQRYDRNVKVPKEYMEYKIPPLTTSFDMPVKPLGWTPCFHPEGALYFFHKGKRIFTDANLYEDDMLSQILSDIAAIEEFFRVQNIQFSRHVDLVLELLREGGQIKTFYYMVDHSKRSIFFLDQFDAADFPIWSEVQGVHSPTHIGHEIQSQYWYHCLMFPRSIELSQDLVNELRDILIHSMGDQILSPTSTVPYSVGDLEKMLSLANNLKKNVHGKFQGSTCFLSSLMYVFVRQRFYDFHGQPGARMGSDQSVYGKAQHKRSWIILSLSPCLFFAPHVHLRALEKMWIDGITRSVLWADFMAKLYAEWQEFTLYGTVLLNANVAFLAIQSVDENHENARSPAQIASYASIAASIGTIILGLLLVRQNRSKGRDTVVDASTYLHKRSNQAMGLETLAIMFALPYALLMWGMVSFLFAFLYICFEGSDIYTRMLVGAAWVAIASLIMCCIWMAWEQLPESESAVDESDSGVKEEVNTNEQLSGQKVVSKPSGIAWKWRALIFRRGTTDSERTVV